MLRSAVSRCFAAANFIAGKLQSQKSVNLAITQHPNFARFTARTFATMDAKLDAIPAVDIDAEGRFKYILIRVYAKQLPDGTEPSKLIVRGFLRAEWHADIYEEVTPGIQALGLDTECLGGGRIEHFPDAEKLKVYGHSTGYGKADHQESRKVLLTKYPNYAIETSDEGY